MFRLFSTDSGNIPCAHALPSWGRTLGTERGLHASVENVPKSGGHAQQEHKCVKSGSVVIFGMQVFYEWSAIALGYNIFYILFLWH